MSNLCFVTYDKILSSFRMGPLGGTFVDMVKYKLLICIPTLNKKRGKSSYFDCNTIKSSMFLLLFRVKLKLRLYSFNIFMLRQPG